jgi:hypothetical protein
MRKIIGYVFFFVAFSIPVFPQSPADGHLEGNTYVNTYFHFSYSWSENVKPRDPRTLNVSGTPSKEEFLMFSAQEGDKPFGIVMLAEKLGPTQKDPRGIRDGSDFLNRVIGGWTPATPRKVLNRSRTTGTHGLTFDELDYMQGGEWNSAITTQIDGYLIAFRCSADNASELAKMKTSVLASRLTAGH